MFDNISLAEKGSPLAYVSQGAPLPFAKYIALTRAMIEDRRTDLHRVPGLPVLSIVDANSPFEFCPDRPLLSGNRIKYGALLIHGLFDCPFSLKDIATRLQQNGVLCRSILLPGHGTVPSDLLSVSYQDWIQALHYGIDGLRDQVEKLCLIGYSTGAALSLYQALQDERISGVALVSPAVSVKPIVDMLVNWHVVKQYFHAGNKQWICVEKEIDYVKYSSLALNPVMQLVALTQTLQQLRKQHTIHCPMFMVLSRDDETISCHKAMDFFSSFSHPNSQLILYTSRTQPCKDKRIIVRKSQYPELGIRHFSHKSLPFAPDNPHYGPQGDYKYASQLSPQSCVYGGYNRCTVDICQLLYKYKILKNKCCELTYNPDFNFTADALLQFMKGL